MFFSVPFHPLSCRVQSPGILSGEKGATKRERAGRRSRFLAGWTPYEDLNHRAIGLLPCILRRPNVLLKSLRSSRESRDRNVAKSFFFFLVANRSTLLIDATRSRETLSVPMIDGLPFQRIVFLADGRCSKRFHVK